MTINWNREKRNVVEKEKNPEGSVRYAHPSPVFDDLGYMEHNVKKILNMDPITDNWWKEEILFLFFDLCCEKWSDFPSLWETLEATYVKEKACTSSYMPSEARIAGQLVINWKRRKKDFKAEEEVL